MDAGEQDAEQQPLKALGGGGLRPALFQSSLRRTIRWQTEGNNLVKPTKAQVWNYKSIEQSAAVPLAEAVTVLVEKYKSGKTAYLETVAESPLPATSGSPRVPRLSPSG